MSHFEEVFTLHLLLFKMGGWWRWATGYSGWSGAQPDGRCVCLC